MDIDVQNIFKDLYKPVRYKLYYGGRGGGKSWAFALALVLRALQSKVSVLCIRFTDVSSENSTRLLLWNTIERLGFEKRFKKRYDGLFCDNGSRFVFRGLYGSALRSQGLKSFEGVDYCWVEEAQELNEDALRLLLPTIRKPNSEIWFSMNRHRANDVVYANFAHRKDAVVHKVNYYDNKYCPDVILEEAEAMKRDNYEEYMHVYEGEPLSHVETGVLQPTAVRGAMHRDIAVRRGELHVGVDVARFGDDKTCIVARIGNVVVRTNQFSKCSIVHVAGECCEIADGHKTMFYVDDVGVGGGLTDLLIASGHVVVPIHNNGKPRNKRLYANRITEIWFEFARNIHRFSIPRDEMLYDELTSREYTYKPDENGKLRKIVLAKEKHKAVLGRSPDYAEALLYSFSDYCDSEAFSGDLQLITRDAKKTLEPYSEKLLEHRNALSEL